MLFQDEDDHYCLKCGSTVSGIDNYISHRKRDCHPEEEDTKKDAVEIETIAESFPEASKDTPTDQFFSVLQLQRRSEVTACEKAAPGVVTRSKVKTGEVKETRRYGGAKRKATVVKASIQKKAKKAEKGGKNEAIGEVGEGDVWLSFDREEKTPQPLKLHPEIYSMSPSYMVDLPEVRDVEVDKFLQDVHYEDTYDTFMGIDDIHYDPPRTEPKTKAGSSPMPWFGQSGWDLLDHEEPELSKGKRSVPPPTHTGGKWKPVSLHPPESGGKWRSFTSTEPKFPPEGHTGGKFGPRPGDKSPIPEPSEGSWRRVPTRYPSPSHTSGKWTPLDPMAPPVDHTRGKWLPSPQSSGKCLKTSGGGVEYYCATCRRRLASKDMYKRHIMSEFHLKRIAHENDLEYDVRSRKVRSHQGRDSEGKRKVKVPVKFEPSGEGSGRKSARTSPSKRRKKKDKSCATCKAKIRKGNRGKHLVSYHHYRRSNLNDPLHREQILTDIAAIIRQSPYQCSPCRFYCNTAAQFRAHWHGEAHIDGPKKGRHFWCSFCKFRCETSDQIRQHLDSDDHGEVIRSINGSMPVIIRSPVTIQCNICKKDLRLSIRLKAHMEKFHGRPPDVAEVLQCRTCSYVADSRKKLQAHAIRSHGNTTAGCDFYCSVCNASFQTAKEALEHRSSSVHRYAVLSKKSSPKAETLERKCSICAQKFETPLGLIEHNASVHKIYHFCVKCGEKFACSQHLSAHSNMGKCKFPTKPSRTPQLWNCRQCSFGTDKKSDFLYHGVLHSSGYESGGLLACPECKKLFSRRQLRGHLQWHTAEQPYKCDACQKRFSYPGLLSQHQKKGCGKLPKKGTTSKEVWECNVCGYKGKTRTLLKRHTLTHQNLCKFTCPHCPFKAKLVDHLKRHLRLHTGAKPFKCPYCSYSCNLLENLRKHVLLTKAHPGRKMYECPDCKFGTNAAKAFDEHLPAAHPEKYEQGPKYHQWNIYSPVDDTMSTDTPLRAVNSEKRRKTRREAEKKKRTTFVKPSILRRVPVPIAPAPSSLATSQRERSSELGPRDQTQSENHYFVPTDSVNVTKVPNQTVTSDECIFQSINPLNQSIQLTPHSQVRSVSSINLNPRNRVESVTTTSQHGQILQLVEQNISVNGSSPILELAQLDGAVTSTSENNHVLQLVSSDKEDSVGLTSQSDQIFEVVPDNQLDSAVEIFDSTLEILEEEEEEIVASEVYFIEGEQLYVVRN